VIGKSLIATLKSTAIKLTQLYYPSHPQLHNSTVAMRDHDRNNISSGSFQVSTADCSAAYSLSLLATEKKKPYHNSKTPIIFHTDLGQQMLTWFNSHKNVCHQMPECLTLK
jgi:hypothetical protein